MLLVHTCVLHLLRMEGGLKPFKLRGCISISSLRNLVRLLSHIIEQWKCVIKVEFIYQDARRTSENGFHHLTTFQPHCSSTCLFRHGHIQNHDCPSPHITLQLAGQFLNLAYFRLDLCHFADVNSHSDIMLYCMPVRGIERISNLAESKTMPRSVK